MKKKRKTKAERDQETANAERRAWDEFCSQFALVKTMGDAHKLVAMAVAPDAPGRRFYSNFGFFLHAFTVPFGSSYEEKEMYIQFIKRLDETKILKAGSAKKIEEDLRKAMGQQGS
jgi:hypothetical protein